MKRLLIIIIFYLPALLATAQRQANSGRQNVTLNPNSGYANVTEATFGYGVAGTTMPYSQWYYGFTSSHGYQLNIYGLNLSTNLFIGLGSGLLVYKEGNLVPAFVDIRFTWDKKKVEPFLYGNSGLLIGVKNLDENTKLYINGGGGIRYRIDDSFAVSLGGGLLLQMGTSRASFLNVKAGVTYKLNRY
ncbi:MAG TPA: hypothetical protein DEO60_04185 [Bacteroidales bacterium]|nr:hypothetical protein [Bacteroidales bacterium]HBZ20306.1 hypothetical protein [Bacteroidales bacterium]